MITEQREVIAELVSNLIQMTSIRREFLWIESAQVGRVEELFERKDDIHDLEGADLVGRSVDEVWPLSRNRRNDVAGA